MGFSLSFGEVLDQYSRELEIIQLSPLYLTYLTKHTYLCNRADFMPL